MRKILVALALSVGLVLPAKAWDVADLNLTVNQSNFIVANQCSGTLISLKYRLVLTNHHCVDSFYHVREYEESDADGKIRKEKREERRDLSLTQRSYVGHRLVGSTEYTAIIVAHKKKSDLALLQIRAVDLPYVKESRMLQNGAGVVRGETAYVVGNPLMLDATVTKGIISSVNRMLRVSWADGAEVPFIQTDAALNPGSSGGAMYNNDGFLIGVPAARHDGIGLAIPYTAIREFLDGICYGEVWNDKADPYDKCVADKKAEAEKKRR